MKRFNWAEKYPVLADKVQSKTELREQLVQDASFALDFAHHASVALGIPFVKSEFFTQQPPTTTFYRQWRNFFNWSADCLPIARWDDCLYVAFWDELPQMPEHLKVVPVLASAHDMENLWQTFLPHAPNVNIEAKPSSPPPIAPPMPQQQEKLVKAVPRTLPPENPPGVAEIPLPLLQSKPTDEAKPLMPLVSETPAEAMPSPPPFQEIHFPEISSALEEKLENEKPLMGIQVPNQEVPSPIQKIEFPIATPVVPVAEEIKLETTPVAPAPKNPQSDNFDPDSLQIAPPNLNLNSAPSDEVVLLDSSGDEEESAPEGEKSESDSEEVSGAPDLLQMDSAQPVKLEFTAIASAAAAPADAPAAPTPPPTNLAAAPPVASQPVKEVAPPPVAAPAIDEETKAFELPPIPAPPPAVAAESKEEIAPPPQTRIVKQLEKTNAAIEVPPVTLPSIKIGNAPEVRATPKVVESVSKPSEYELHAMLKGNELNFIKSLQSLCAGEYENFAVWAIDKTGRRIAAVGDSKDLALDNTNFFRLVQWTERPYHGKPFVNPWTENFFQQVEKGQSPSTVTVLPIFKDKQILGFGYFSSKEKTHSLKTLNHIANDFQKTTTTLLTGPAKAA